MWPITAMTGGRGARAIMDSVHHKNALIAMRYNRFMFGRRRIYLDYAAAAPVRSVARRAYARAARAYGNPSSPHEEGRAAEAVLEEARLRLARLTETKADDI